MGKILCTMVVALGMCALMTEDLQAGKQKYKSTVVSSSQGTVTRTYSTVQTAPVLQVMGFQAMRYPPATSSAPVPANAESSQSPTQYYSRTVTRSNGVAASTRCSCGCNKENCNCSANQANSYSGPQAEVQGTTTYDHLIRYHGYTPEQLNGLNQKQLDNLHSAAHN